MYDLATCNFWFGVLGIFVWDGQTVMIDTDEVGQKKLSELVKYMYDRSVDYSEWEIEFLQRIGSAPYKWLSPKQKAAIGRVYDARVMQR